MTSMLRIIRANRLYAVLLVFVVFINLLAFTDKLARDAQDKAAIEKARQEGRIRTDVSEEETFFDEEGMKARQDKMQKLAEDQPIFYFFLAVFNLFILFILFVGLLLDIYFLARFFRKKPVNIRAASPEAPRWSVADVIRVALIFLSAGYIFVIAQAFMTRMFPILNNENFHMVFNTAVVNIVGISVILYFVVEKYGQRAETIGLTSKGFLNNIFYAAVGYIAIAPIFVMIMIATFFVTKAFGYKPPVQPIVEVFMKEKATLVLWFSASFAAVFGPIAEEIFFRGFMYRAFRAKLGIFWGVVITAFLFSLLHIHVVGFLPIMALGLLLAYLYEKTGSLVAPITVHIMHNVGMLTLVFMMRHIGT